MDKHILFIQGGGGEEDHAADGKLVASLQKALGKRYDIRYPLLLNDESAPDFGRIKQIGKEISLIKDEIILVGHSLGASMLLKYLSESQVRHNIAGIFLIATPFGAATKTGNKASSFTRILAMEYRKTFRFFFTIARMTKKYPLPTSIFMHKTYRKPTSEK